MSAVRSSLQPLPEAAADRLRSTRRPSRWPAALIDLGAVLLVWSVGAFYFFGREWSTGFRMVDGDSHDTVLQIYLQEHWFHVLNGDASWRNPAIFYPIKDVLGWSDGFVLFEVFYAPLRAVGFDIFLSAELTLILFSLVGFASFVYLTRLAFGVQRWVALIGGLAFTFANNLWIHLYWLQFPTVWMVPGLLLLAVLAFRCFDGHRLTALVLGALSGLGAALLFLTAFYVAWFCALAGGVALVILLLGGRGRSVRWLLRHWHESRWLVLTIGGAFAVGLVPFLATYLPAQKAIQHLSYSAVMFYAPTPRDLLNFGTQNVFWSPVARHVLSNFHLTFSALTWAVTPLVMVLAVAGSALAWWTTRSDAGRAHAATARAAAVLAGTAVVLSALPLKTRFGSLWSLVWHLPGADAIRRTNRIGAVIGLVACLALVCAASVLYRAAGRRPDRTFRSAAIVVLLLLTVAEQYNTTVLTGLDRSAEMSFLGSVKSPPSGCRSFYVVDPAHSFLAPTSALGSSLAVTDQIDAMLVSEKYLLPTLNGYSGYAPAGWGLAAPFSPSYLPAVRSWARAHGIQGGLCQLDLRTLQWHMETAAS